MKQRGELLNDIAETILNLPRHHTVRVGVDGVDGAGKTTFADELAKILETSDRTIIRASVDGFHNPKSTRYRLGRDSPQGFFLDSYNYPELKAALLEPLSPSGIGRYRTAAFDHRANSPVSAPEEEAAPGAILIFDGIFLHRLELRGYWDFSIFLEVGFDVSIPRGAQRGEGSPDPQAAENYRYVAGQKIYLQECQPRRRATLVINNENLAAPYLVQRSR